jgi:hypothetical protein
MDEVNIRIVNVTISDGDILEEAVLSDLIAFWFSQTEKSFVVGKSISKIFWLASSPPHNKQKHPFRLTIHFGDMPPDTILDSIIEIDYPVMNVTYDPQKLSGTDNFRSESYVIDYHLVDKLRYSLGQITINSYHVKQKFVVEHEPVEQILTTQTNSRMKVTMLEDDFVVVSDDEDDDPVDLFGCVSNYHREINGDVTCCVVS